MTDKPKCPLKFHLQAFEGGEECDEGCAWFMTDSDEFDRHSCAMAVIAICVGKQPNIYDVNTWVIDNEVVDI